MSEIDERRENYAKVEQEWREHFRPAFLSLVQSGEFNEVEFIFYAGIGIQEWMNLVKHDRIAQDSWLYAKLFYHLGLAQANPTQLPPRLHIRFGGEVTEIKRSIELDDYLNWASIQKPPYSTLQANTEHDYTLMGVVSLIIELIQDERASRDKFVKANGELLSFVVPFLTALSLDAGERERELARIVHLNRGRLYEMREGR